MRAPDLASAATRSVSRIMSSGATAECRSSLVPNHAKLVDSGLSGTRHYVSNFHRRIAACDDSDASPDSHGSDAMGECHPVSRPPSLAFWYYGFMAMRKMTFSVPEELAVQFLCRIASRDRSRFVSEALAARLEERDTALIRACEIANQDIDVAEIEKELDGLGDVMAEPWR